MCGCGCVGVLGVGGLCMLTCVGGWVDVYESVLSVCIYPVACVCVFLHE